MQDSMMMALGLFVFRLPTIAYQDFKRSTSWRHPSQSRVGRRASRQFLGPGDDQIKLSGVLMPEVAGDILSLDTLRLMGDDGAAWPLIEGTGRIYGLFVIEDIQEGRTLFFADGTPRRIDFEISLTRIDDDRVDLLGDIVATAREQLR